MARSNREDRPELPNLVLATTYALNKSNTKRICVGLEHSVGYFYEVVKLINSGTHKHVTLDTSSWESLRDQFGMIAAYFQNSYSFYEDYGRTSKVYLQRHDLDFTTSYGIKSITIDERPRMGNSVGEEDMESQSQAITETPCRKKLKFDHPPGIVMQQATFDGLRIQSVLIELWLQVLKERVGKVNRVVDLIFEFLKGKLENEQPDAVQNIFSNLNAFKQFYTSHKGNIEGFVNDKLIDDSDNFKSLYLNIVLSEIMIFCLPMFMRELKEIVIPA